MLEGDEVPDWCPFPVLCVGGGGGVECGGAVVAQRPVR